MTRQPWLCALIGFAVAVQVGLFAQNPDQQPNPAVMQAAKAAFPTDLLGAAEPSSGSGSPRHRYSTCAAVYSRSANGGPNLIAAAYSGDGAEIAMLASTTNGAKIISAITNQQFWLTDGECNLQMVNLADPSHPDSSLANTIDVTFGDGPDWFFIWNGEKLQSITALQEDNYFWRGKQVQNTAMYGADTVDVDHNGAMQIVGNNGDYDKFPKDDGISSTGTLTLFRFNGKTYAAAETLLFLDKYEPQPPNWDESMNGSWADAGYIDMHHAPKPSYQLRIVNGDRDGSNRVTSAKIEINGQLVISPTDVNTAVETLTETIQMQKQNEITVAVTGPPKSHLYVTVE